MIIALISAFTKFYQVLPSPHLRFFHEVEGLPVLHGFLLSLQNHPQNLPQRYRFHSFPDFCRNSLQVFQEGHSLKCCFLLVRSRAFLAASLALCASTDFSQIILATCRILLQKYVSCSLTTLSTAPRASLFPSFCLVCPSN